MLIEESYLNKSVLMRVSRYFLAGLAVIIISCLTTVHGRIDLRDRLTLLWLNILTAD